ncbi:MAG: hypothetical protein CME01_10870 [Geminicoccus sp.]|nr:hypothetical protein [Geminicoccus sp.]
MLLQVTIIIFFNGSEADVQSSNINATSIPKADETNCTRTPPIIPQVKRLKKSPFNAMRKTDQSGGYLIRKTKAVIIGQNG